MLYKNQHNVKKVPVFEKFVLFYSPSQSYCYIRHD